MFNFNYRYSILFYIISFFLLILPSIIKGDIIAPHKQFIELNNDSQSTNDQIENRKFSDFSSVFLPRVTEQLNDNNKSWLTLWSNQNELGRPVYHTTEFSLAYPVAFLISIFTKNPLISINIISLILVFLTGLFLILYCKEININSFAALISGLIVLTSPILMYWLTFPLFLSVWCWCLGVLWSLTSLSKKNSLLGWTVLAFSVYSLLMTAYPQPIVYHMYIFGAYGSVLAYKKYKNSKNEGLHFLLSVFSALLIAVILVVPVYIDLYYIYLDSARTNTSVKFFTEALPVFNNYKDVIKFFILLFIPEVYGNPIKPNFPLTYNGLSLTVVSAFFIILGAIISFRKTYGWWIAIVILTLLTFNKEFYGFGVKYLGLNLSRGIPLTHLFIPLTIIMVQGINYFIERKLININYFNKITLSIIIVLIFILATVAFLINDGTKVHWSFLTMMLIALMSFMLQIKNVKPVLLILIIIISTYSVSMPLVLKQKSAQIAMSSEFINKIKANIPNGSKYAIVSPNLNIIPPNINATLNLNSIHTYNSLSSKYYHNLIEQLGGDIRTFGRLNQYILPEYSSTAFWMSNIGLILSSDKIIDNNLILIEEILGINFYKVKSRMGEAILLELSDKELAGIDLNQLEPRDFKTYEINKEVNKNDFIAINLNQKNSSILILSQKYHKDWMAEVKTEKGWVKVPTMAVNNIFQGVLLPQTSKRVEISFKPYSKYAWIAHLFWMLVFICIIFKSLKKYNLKINKS